MITALAPFLRITAKVASNASPGRCMCGCVAIPMLVAALSISARKDLVNGSAALAKIATRRADGTMSRMSSIHLPPSCAPKLSIPVTLPPGQGQTGDETGFDRIACAHDNRNLGRRLLRCGGRRCLPGDDDIDLATNEVGRRVRKRVCLRSRGSDLQLDIPTVDVAKFLEAVPELLQERLGISIPENQNADPPHLVGLLRARGEWPRCDATHDTKKLSPLHARSILKTGYRNGLNEHFGRG